MVTLVREVHSEAAGRTGDLRSIQKRSSDVMLLVRFLLQADAGVFRIPIR